MSVPFYFYSRQIFKNTVEAFLASPLSDTAGSFIVETGQGSRFPASCSWQFFIVKITHPTTDAYEILDCWFDLNTIGTSDIICCNRNSYGTPAQNFPVGSKVELVLTAEWINAIHEKVFTDQRVITLLNVADSVSNNTDTVIGNSIGPTYSNIQKYANYTRAGVPNEVPGQNELDVNLSYGIKFSNLEPRAFVRVSGYIKWQINVAAGYKKLKVSFNETGQVSPTVFEVASSDNSASNVSAQSFVSPILQIPVNQSSNGEISVIAFQNSGSNALILAGSWIQIEYVK